MLERGPPQVIGYRDLAGSAESGEEGLEHMSDSAVAAGLAS
jgi:hypothetical protein